MSADFARAVFQVPPFPGASPHAVVRAGPARQVDVDEARIVIEAMRMGRVGGAYWCAPSPNQAPSLQRNLWHEPRTVSAPVSADDATLLLAAIAGHAIAARVGGPFAALYELNPGTSEHQAVLENLVATHLLENVSFHDPFTGAPIDAGALVATLAHWRALIEANRPIAAAFGFARWKRETVDSLLWGGAPVRFLPANEAVLADIPDGTAIAVWKARVPADFLKLAESGRWRLLEVEDGFIRSIGLGADCVPPLSIVVDDQGVHYDPAQPSRLETLIRDAAFPSEDLQRAAALRDTLVRAGISKYDVSGGPTKPRHIRSGRRVLVVGQVEDDRSILFGGAGLTSNLALLERVRAREPDAHIVYRPHPDIEAGHRKGAIPRAKALTLADEIDAASAISDLIAQSDRVHVITSLAGFEALLRDTPVTTHGTPFYAGWGLTEDLAPVPERRGVNRSLDTLIAAVLLHYPRYLDPQTRLPCTPETLVMRLTSGVGRQNGALVPLRRIQGWANRNIARMMSGR